MSKKILFMGTPAYATCIFESLLNSKYELVGLFTQEDKKIGRKQILTPPHIKQFCLDNKVNIPIYQAKSLKNNNEALELIKTLNPDFIIVASFGQILPKEVLDLAPCINLHASLLPKYRGASPIQEALLNDDKYTGITAMLMEEGLDSGDILALKYFKIPNNMKAEELFANLSKLAATLSLETLDNFDKIKPKKQNSCEVSFCKKIKKEDGLVDLKSAKKLYLKYKAYSFWPGIFLHSGLKLKDIEVNDLSSNNEAGEILEFLDDGIILACKQGSLKIKTIQAPSKKALSSLEYIRGKRLNIGDILS